MKAAKRSFALAGRRYIESHPESDEEFEAIAALNAAIHGEGAAALCRALDSGYPGMERGDWYAILDGEDGRVLSTLCLIPTDWGYRGCGREVCLRAAELGLVSTAGDSRNLGLSTYLIRRFLEDVEARGFQLSTIEGIPNFYRRFGYEYAVELANQVRLGPGLSPWREEYASDRESAEAGDRASFAGIAAAGGKAMGGFRLRPAVPADKGLLSRLFDDCCSGLSVYSPRDEATWDFLLGPAKASPDTFVSRLVISSSTGDKVEGYLGFQYDNFGPGLALAEASLFRGAAPEAVLAVADALREEAGYPFLTVALPRTHPLAACALARGAQDRWEYAWQVKAPDPRSLLETIAPVLEARLGSSAWSGRPYRLDLSFYGKGIGFAWDGSVLSLGPIEQTGPAPEAATRPPARLPVDLLCPLVLGYRSVAELRHLRHDVSIYREDEAFIDVIFPKGDSFMYPLF